MALLGNIYTNAILLLEEGKLNLPSDALKYMLLTSSYTPSLDSDINYAGISANEVSGTGYTAGGQAVAGATLTQIAANSWTGTWVASTAFNVNQVIRPATGNGFLYLCVVAGTTGATTPTFPTVPGTTVADGGATWLCIGSAAVKFTFTSPSWASSTITARYGVLYDTTATGSPLVGVQDFGGNISSSGSAFNVTIDANSGFLVGFRL